MKPTRQRGGGHSALQWGAVGLVALALSLRGARAEGPPKELKIAGFAVRVLQFAEGAGPEYSGEGVLALPFPALPQNLRELPVTFAGWGIDPQGGVKTGTLALTLQDWKWTAPGGFSFALTRVTLDAAAGACKINGSLSLANVFTLSNIEGAGLTPEGLLQNVPLFRAAGANVAAPQVSLDLSAQGPPGREAFLGIVAPELTLTLPEPYQALKCTGNDLALGVQDGAVRVIGTLRLDAPDVTLADIAGSGIDVAIKAPTLQYADGWSLAGDVSARLPAWLQRRQVELKGAGISLTPGGRLECVAPEVALAPALDVDLGLFEARGVETIGLDFSETRALAETVNGEAGEAWRGILLRSGRAAIPLPVAQEERPEALEFAFKDLGIGVANGQPKLSGKVSLKWAAGENQGRAFTLAGWKGSLLTLTSAGVDLALGPNTAAEGWATGSIALPALQGEQLRFENARWSSAGLYAPVRLDNDIAPRLPAPLNGTLTIKRGTQDAPSAILDLSAAASPDAGPDFVRDPAWQGLYLADAALALPVAGLGNVTFAAKECYLDGRGLSASLALDAAMVRPLEAGGKPSFPVRWHSAAVTLEHGALESGALAGDLYLCDKPIAFELAVAPGGRWFGQLRTQKAPSLDLGLIRLAFTEGTFDPAGILRCSGYAYPRIGGESQPVPFADLVIKWPLEIPRLEFALAQPAGFQLFGFHGAISRFAFETRADPAAIRTTLAGRLLLPEAQGLTAFVEIPGLTVAVPYGAQSLELPGGIKVPKLGAPALEWEGNGALVYVKVANVLEARGGVVWTEQGKAREFRGDLDLAWQGQAAKAGTAHFALGHDAEGDYWLLKLDSPVSVPVGPGLRFTHLKVAAAWGMRAPAVEPQDPGDQEPAAPPEMNRDPKIRFFAGGFARLVSEGDRFQGWFGMALGLPGPYIALSGSPLLIGQRLGHMHLSWDPDRSEFHASGSFQEAFSRFPHPPGFTLRPSQYDVLLSPARWHLKMGWPEKERPSLTDLNVMAGPPAAIPNAIGWGLALQGQGDPANLGLGAALAAGLQAQGQWVIFYARGSITLGGKLWVELAPATPHPMYGGGTVWAEVTGKGGLKVAGTRYEVISVNADTVVAVLSPGPPDKDYGGRKYRADKWQVAGSLQLAYHLRLLLVSFNGSTKWAFATSF